MASVPQAPQRQQSLPSYTRPASICGGFIGSKRALLAFTWTVTTLLTFVGFFVAVVFVMRIQSHYRYLNRLYASDDDYGNQQQEDGEGEDERNSEDYRNQQLYPLLSSTSSAGVTFVGLWMMFLSVALTLYGSTAIVGFTSFQGVYIAPCFASRNQMKVGIFGGAIVVFANMLLLCAVLFGEVWVQDNREGREREETEPYALERIATILAITCMFLSALYFIFAVLLFITYVSDYNHHNPHGSHQPSTARDDNRSKPLVGMDRQFITMGGSS